MTDPCPWLCCAVLLPRFDQEQASCQKLSSPNLLQPRPPGGQPRFCVLCPVSKVTLYYGLALFTAQKPVEWYSVLDMEWRIEKKCWKVGPPCWKGYTVAGRAMQLAV